MNVQIISARELSGTSKNSGKPYKLFILQGIADLGEENGLQVFEATHDQLVRPGKYVIVPRLSVNREKRLEIRAQDYQAVNPAAPK